MNGVICETELKSPIAVKWTIPENRLIQLIGQPGAYLKSDPFAASNMPGVKYFIVFYPNGHRSQEHGGSWMSLHLAYSGEMKIEAYFRISVESANFCHEDRHTFENSAGRGIKCSSKNDLFDPSMGYIVDGKLTIKVSGFLMTQKYDFMSKKEESIEDARDALCLGLWEQEEAKDFAIVAEGKEIRAHKNILSARSPVFTRMLQSDMKESKEGKVIIKDFTFDIVETAIKACYHKSLVPEASLEDAVKLLQFFDKYDIQSLKNDLETKLIAILNSSNVCRLTNCALLTNTLELEEKCTKFLQECFDERKPIGDIDLLDKDFAFMIFKSAFYHVSS